MEPVNEEIKRREAMLRAIAYASGQLLSNTDLMDAVAMSLPELGKAVGVDRIYLFQNRITPEGNVFSSQKLEWNSGYSAPQIDNPDMQELDLNKYSFIFERLSQGISFSVSVSQLPDQSSYVNLLESQEIKSVLTTPIFTGQVFWGFLGYDDCQKERNWADDEIAILKIFSNNIAIALERSQIEKEYQQLSVVASASMQGVHFTDSAYSIRYANEALSAMTGYTVNELIGKNAMEIFTGPLTQTDAIKKINSGTSSREPVNVDLIIYRKDSSHFWANVKKQPFTNKEKGTVEFFTIIEDISRKKHSEDSVKRSESILKLLISNISGGFLLEDSDRKLLYTNKTFCTFFGIPEEPEQLTGSNCESALEIANNLFRNPSETRDRINQLISEKKAVTGEEIELTNGTIMERDYVPVIIDGSFGGHFWKYTDITDRKLREKILTQQEAKYRNLIANMKMGIIETDENDTIKYVNQQFCKMSGYTADEAVGKKSVDFLVADEFRNLLINKNILRSEGIADTYQLQIKTKEGEKKWWLTSGSPNYNDKGKFIGTVGISIDVTDQKLLEQELVISRKKAEQSSVAKEVFLAGMSHEIRTPLNVIIGLIREMSREILNPRLDMYVRNAGLASRHLLALLNNILDITQIESGQLELKTGPFSLIDVVNDSIAILTSEAKEKMVELNCDISPMLAAAYIGDAVRLRQIFMNIIGNAIRFTEKGKIDVEFALTGADTGLHHIMIKVTDTGVGMDDKLLQKIFEKFSTSDFNYARKSGGVGLGLAITYQLIRLMDGTINISSLKDFGTVVEVEIDLPVADVKELESEVIPSGTETLKGKKILLAEDNDLNRLVAVNSLVFHGLEVTEAVNGNDAIQKMRDKTFDLILMDLQMPVLGGLEATRTIRHELNSEIPIVALTAHAFKAEIDRCIEAGMNDYIIKPFDENQLIATIRKNIGLGSGKSESAEEIMEIKDKPKLCDLSTIEALSRGNIDFIKKMIDIFVDQTPAAVNEIRNAFKNNELETVKKVAHRIKPNLANFGIVSLHDDIRSIETIAEEGVATTVLGQKIERLEKIISEAVEELKTYEIGSTA